MMAAAGTADIATDAAARRTAVVTYSDETGILTADLSGPAAADAILLSAGERRIATLHPTASENGGRRLVFDLRMLPADLLLAPRITITGTRVDASDETVFALEIECGKLHPLRSVPPETGSLEGHIDGLMDGTVRGWAFDPAAPDRRVEVRLFVDGTFAGMSVASRMRPDLLATGRGDGCYGFEIPAAAFVARAGGDHATLTVVAGSENRRLPSSASPVQPKRRSLRLPKRRSRPVDLREFVALLSATEPFPKRSYVIDPKIDGPMPDAFSADYLVLALEYLRVDMVRTHAAEPRGLRQRLLRWLRLRKIATQIRRLTALAEATITSQDLLKSSSRSLDAAKPVPPR